METEAMMAATRQNTQMDAGTPPSYQYALGVITLTVAMFSVIGFVTTFTTPRSAKSAWKYKNIVCSLIHAIISGVWAFHCLLVLPEMAEDVIHTYNTSAYTLVCFTVGYVIYDSMDMCMYHRKRESFELLGHHSIIVLCYGISLILHTYVGYAIVSLLVEVNSVFLHIRQLRLICKADKTSPLHRLISVLNIGTFITFRIITFGWMTRWLFTNKDAVPLLFFSVGSFGLAVITLMNIILFYRLLKADFFRTLPANNNNKSE